MLGSSSKLAYTRFTPVTPQMFTNELAVLCEASIVSASMVTTILDPFVSIAVFSAFYACAWQTMHWLCPTLKAPDMASPSA